ncbi:MAG: Fic family protein [Lachnospiraceae bacterium]|nr:Fic family protein [Lachnospiraceae bacterium]
MDYIQLSKEYYKNRENYEQLYQSRFYNEFTLHIPIRINGNDAFLTYPPEMFQLVTKIYKMNTLLYEKIQLLPDIALEQFTKKCLIDEIKLSNDIEGIYSTRKEIRELLKPQTTEHCQKRLYGLVQKYNMLSHNENISIASCKDIREIYDDLVLKEVMEEDIQNKPDGVFFRKDSVSIQGNDLKIIHHGVNPEEKIISYMDECLKLIKDDTLNPVIAASMIHYFIGYIHPFYDGNGRLNRFISSYLLSKELHTLVGYSLSYTIKKQVDIYYKAFKITNEARNKGDITPFVLIFLDFIRQALEHLNTTLADKIEQMTFYYKKIMTVSKEDKLLDLLFALMQNSLFGEEGMTVEILASELSVSVPTIRNYINNIDNEMLKVSKIGHKNAFDINLEYFNSI